MNPNEWERKDRIGCITRSIDDARQEERRRRGSHRRRPPFNQRVEAREEDLAMNGCRKWDHETRTKRRQQSKATDPRQTQTDGEKGRRHATEEGKRGKRLMSDSLAHMQSPAQEESEPRLRRGYTCTREGERHSLRRRQLVQCHSLVQGSRTRESREQQVQRELMFLSVF